MQVLLLSRGETERVLSQKAGTTPSGPFNSEG